MKKLALYFLPIFIALSAALAAPWHGSATSGAALNCNANPGVVKSDNGCTILEPGPGILLTDNALNTYNFDGVTTPLGTDAEYEQNGSPVTSANTIQINSGHANQTMFRKIAGAIPSALRTWQYHTGSGDFVPAVTPTAADIGPVFLDVTQSTSQLSPSRLLSAASNNDVLTIPLMPAGVSSWPGFTVSQTGLTVNCAAGAIVFNDEIALLTGANNVTFNNCGSAYAQGGPSNGPNLGYRIFRGALNPTFNAITAHDNDDGMLAAGTNGNVTFGGGTNIYHNGFYNGSGDCAGFDHGIYWSYNGTGLTAPPPDTTVLTFNNTNGANQSVDTRCQGDPLKLRNNGGTIAFMTTGNTGRYSTDTNVGMNWPVSVPCGGPWIVNHSTFERPPNTGSLGGNYGDFDYGSEWPGALGNGWNCPANTTFTANTTSGSPTLTSVSTITNIVQGAAISCSAGLPTGNGNLLTITTTPSGATLTLSGNATSNQSGVSCQTTRNHTGTFSNINFVDDGDSDAGHPSPALRCNGNCTSKGYSLTVTNSNVVAAAFPGCGGAYLGDGVTDGGGNHCYTSRTALCAALAGGCPSPDIYGNVAPNYPYQIPNP